MFTWVIGFPAGLYMGFASTSILEVEIPGKPDVVTPFPGVSFLTAEAFTVKSLAVSRCGMFRISLYRGWLRMC